MATVQVQSNASKNKIAKLSYQRRGPFEIVSHLGHGAYKLRSLLRPDVALLKFHSSSISPLPPGLLPCDPIDTSDLRYLNQNSTPTANPLRSLDIQMYNNVWFEDKPKSYPAPFDFSTPSRPSLAAPFPLRRRTPRIPCCLSSTDTLIPPSLDPILCFDSNADADPQGNAVDPFAPYPSSSVVPLSSHLYDSIVATTDRMFFV
jgi:hypothetical protein